MVILKFQLYTEWVIQTSASKLVHLALNQNYFIFNNSVYSQPAGLPMGSPISPLFSDIYMDDLESQFLNNSKFQKNILFYYRYVDDIICLWSGTHRQLSTFLNHINSLSPTIKFTVEHENNRSLNFLDLTITRLESSLEFNIFRKPTFTDTLIPYSSSHPLSQKLASFHSMIFRLLKVPLSTSNYEKELNTILHLASSNGYPHSIIFNILNKKKKSIMLKSIYSPTSVSSPKFKRILFSPQYSSLIANTCNKHNITPAFYTKHALKHTIVNNKLDRPDPLKKSGVYRLNCSDCSKYYIGKTDRSFLTRHKEHLAAFRNNPDTSNFATHLIEEGHSVQNSSIVPLHICTNPIKNSTLEKYYILNSPSSLLLNDQKNFPASPFLKNPESPCISQQYPPPSLPIVT